MSPDPLVCAAEFPHEAPEDPQGPCVLDIGHVQPHTNSTGSWYDRADQPAP